ISVLPLLADGIARSYRPDIDGLFLRANITPTVQVLLDALLGPIGQILPPGGQPCPGSCVPWRSWSGWLCPPAAAAPRPRAPPPATSRPPPPSDTTGFS